MMVTKSLQGRLQRKEMPRSSTATSEGRDSGCRITSASAINSISGECTFLRISGYRPWIPSLNPACFHTFVWPRDPSRCIFRRGLHSPEKRISSVVLQPGPLDRSNDGNVSAALTMSGEFAQRLRNSKEGSHSLYGQGACGA